MPSVRHLTLSQAVAALRRNVHVEQFLGVESDGLGRVVIRWLTAAPAGSGFVLLLHAVEYIGSGFDVAEFPPLDEDEHVGEGRRIAESEDPSVLLTIAAEHGAVPDRWVNQGVVGEEYRDARGR